MIVAARLVLLELLYLLLESFRATTATTCYCTFKDCGAAFCDNDWCLVGFKKNDRGQIYQNCATDEYAKTVRPCKVDLDIWEEVCKCDKKNCNTYSYYRRAIDVDVTKDDQPYNFDNPFMGPEGNSNGFSNSQLIILLICVPLGVGVVAVVFVFINYHCKL